jgi:CheY-like chemotaxis protein
MNRPRVLVVEDHPYNRDLVEQLLEDDYELSFAHDGQMALDAIFSEDAAYDAVLLDISIPKVDGLEVARRIRSSPRHCGIPLIAVTAHAMQGDAERAQAAGCNAHISKPIDEAVLLRELERHCRRRR